MLELLQSRGSIGGPELARRLEVGERTIRRYAVMLQEMGVPVEGKRGRHGAYSLRPGFRLPPMMFTEDEALGLALSLLAARRLGLSGAAPAVEGALAKLERVMPEALVGRVRALQETISLAVASPAAQVSSESLLTLAAAVGERSRVRMRYRAVYEGMERETERDVDPYGVMNREGLWYFVGHCHLRSGLRLFRVDRVLEAGTTGEEFVRPAGLDSQKALLDAVAETTDDEWSVEVLVEAEEDPVRWQLPSVGFALESVEGGTLMRCSTWNLDWVSRVLTSLDCDFVVLRPVELREALLKRAVEISDLAKKAPRETL